MTERNEIPTESDALNWASDGVTYSSADPGAPKRLTGFQPLNEPIPGPGEVIPAEDHNWLWKKGMEFLTWLKDGATRQWYDLAEAISDTDNTLYDVIRIVPPLGSPGGMWDRLEQKWKVTSTAATGGDPSQIITDGEQIYYIGGAVAQSLIAADPLDGSEIWETTAGITQFASVATDGAEVYVTSTNVGEPGLHVRDRTDGTNDRTAGAEYGCNALVANGAFVVGVNGTVGGAGAVTFWTPTTPTETGTVVPGAAANLKLAIDADHCYVGGTRNAAADVWALNLTTRATTWAVAVDANDPSPINAICSDGDCVYVGCDAFVTAAGPTRSIFCLERASGRVLWSMDAGDVDYLAVDGQFLYGVDSTNTLLMIKLQGPGDSPAGVATSPNFASISNASCDGISVVAADSATSTDFRRVMVGVPATEFMIAAGTDPNRRPFFNLAVPVGNGL